MELLKKGTPKNNESVSTQNFGWDSFVFTEIVAQIPQISKVSRPLHFDNSTHKDFIKEFNWEDGYGFGHDVFVATFKSESHSPVSLD